MPARSVRSADENLVARCLAGDEAAWKELEARLLECAHRVLAWVNKALREELIVDALRSLFLHKARLEAFLRSDRSLTGYLGYLLQRERKHHYQELARRRRQLARLARKKLREPEGLLFPEEVLEELDKRLTPAEKRYWQWRQLPEPKDPPPVGPAYARQLERHIWRKARSIVYGP
jgi:hypothetical protein